MFRVQVFPHDISGLEARQILHTCFEPAAGKLLSIGRKKGDILFTQDTSVSREHGILRLASTRSDECRPRNGKEKEACESSSTKSCLVLEAIGKLGTFLVRDATEKQLKPTTDRDSDATDDEGDVSQFASQASTGFSLPLSPVAQHFSSTSSTLHPIQAQDSVILSPDSLSIIQFGKLGSTIVVAPIKFRVLRVSSGKKAKPPLWEKADIMGIEDAAGSVLDKEVTHIVTESRFASPKQIGAWAMGIPAVTNEYWKAIWHRGSASDPFPKVEDFPPKPDKSNFWGVPSNRQLWAKSIFLAVKNDDIINLALGGGAQIIRLYERENDDLAEATSILQDPVLKQACFVTDTRRNSSKKLIEMGATKVTAKELAKFLTEQKPIMIGETLVESDLTILPRTSKEDYVEVIESENKDSVPDPSLKQPPVQTSNRMSSLSVLDRSPDSADRKTEQRALDRSQVCREKQESKNPSRGVSRSKSNADLSSADSRAASSPVSNRKRLRVDSADTGDIKKNGTGSKRCRTIDKANGPEGNQRPVDLPGMFLATAKEYDGERKSLEVLKGGWLVAAPKGEARCEYVRDRQDIINKSGLNEEDLITVATTYVCNGLVSQRKTMSGRGVKRTGKDFRGFRKNNVFCSETRPTIVLKAVLPKESELTVNQEEQTRAFSQQQQRADALFRDPIVTKGRRGRA